MIRLCTVLKADRARKTLAFIRLVNGGIAFVAPRWFLRTIGVDPDTNGPAVYVLRLFGIRTIWLGYQLLAAQGEELDAVIRSAAVIHASDAGAAVLAGLTGALPARAAVTAAITSGINTALSVAARGS